MQQLVSLCRELQREAGDNPFFLAYSVVQTQFKLPAPAVAGRRINDLVKKGVISVVEKYTAKHAARYRYLHPLNDMEKVLQGVVLQSMYDWRFFVTSGVALRMNSS
jgi:hypothetical protein